MYNVATSHNESLEQLFHKVPAPPEKNLALYKNRVTYGAQKKKNHTGVRV